MHTKYRYHMCSIACKDISPLAWRRTPLYCRTSTLHLGFCPILWDPYRSTHRLQLSQKPTLLWTACSKLRPRKLRNGRSIVRTVHVCECGTSTFDRYSGWGVVCSFYPTQNGAPETCMFQYISCMKAACSMHVSVHFMHESYMFHACFSTFHAWK